MKISIITVTYNCADTIEHTINSVVAQDYDEIEYIVIDGASTDGTCEIIKKYADRIAYYCSERDSGIYNAMNKGLKRATGDVVLFMNGDDCFEDDLVLADISREFEMHPDAEIIIGRERINGRISVSYDPNVNRSIYVDTFFPHQATFVRKKLYDTLGGFDEQYRISADYDWILRAYFSGAKVKWVDRVVSVYATGGRSASIACVADEYLISTKYLVKLKEEKLISYAKQHYSKMFCEMLLWEFMNSDTKDPIICNALRSIFGTQERINIWGAGINGRALCRFLQRNDFEITTIFDADRSKSGSVLEGIKIRTYEGADGLIIISTRDYEDDIAATLDEKGLEEFKDYIRFSSLAQELVRQVFEIHQKCGDFYRTTGLRVLDYLS